MKRMQLFEFEDFPWFPKVLRDMLTDTLVSLHRFLRTDEIIAPLLIRLMNASGKRRIVDMCSGGGGAMPRVLKRLRASGHPDVEILLTDLYPNQAAARRIEAENPGMLFHAQPVDAGNVPPSLDGIRTMVCSFHHMPLPVARKILDDAFAKRQPLMVFEISDNSSPKWLWWLAFPVNVAVVFLVTPFVRPFSWQRLLLTYVIPLLPILIGWDGATSNARTYSKDDLREMTAHLAANDYRWEIETVRRRPNPGPVLYLLGIPG